MIQRLGQLIDYCIQGAREHGMRPETRVIARIGDFGEEMEIEFVKVQATAQGRVMVLQLAKPIAPLLRI